MSLELADKPLCCMPGRYQDYQAEQIPVVAQDGATVRVMAGDALGQTGPVALRNPGLLLDVALAPGATFSQQARTPQAGGKR